VSGPASWEAAPRPSSPPWGSCGRTLRARSSILTAYYPFTTVEEVKESTGWDLKVSDEVKMVPEPSEQELANLRSVDTTGSLRKKI
jgi:hypothetical protein